MSKRGRFKRPERAADNPENRGSIVRTAIPTTRSEVAITIDNLNVQIDALLQEAREVEKKRSSFLGVFTSVG